MFSGCCLSVAGAKLFSGCCFFVADAKWFSGSSLSLVTAMIFSSMDEFWWRERRDTVVFLSIRIVTCHPAQKLRKSFIQIIVNKQNKLLEHFRYVLERGASLCDTIVEDVLEWSVEQAYMIQFHGVIKMYPSQLTRSEECYVSRGCWKNDSSAWRISLSQTSSDGTFPNFYLAYGALPNSQYMSDSGTFQPEGYATLGLGDDSQIVALVDTSYRPRTIVLDKVQCDVNFAPYNFEISVNSTNALISVTPLASSTRDMDPTSIDGSGIIAEMVMRQVTFLSMINTNLYTSVLGNVFMSNIVNVATVQNSSVNDTSAILEGISTARESMIDNILVGFASAQLEIAGGNMSVVNATVDALTDVTIATMRIGKFQYVVGIAALNFLIVAVYFGECGRTRGCRGLPPFDYTDIASVMVAVSRGGGELGKCVTRAHKVAGSGWLGDAGGMAGGEKRITLGLRDGMPMIQAVGVVNEDLEEASLKNEQNGAEDTWDFFVAASEI
ncbi:hypothetical protein K438DRAFT_1775950 [Mycena galopus ATCC 62051]|nr:hypothetical protein K438DRAFT_1775950 [Mycena galopus ATCC 62051]